MIWEIMIGCSIYMMEMVGRLVVVVRYTVVGHKPFAPMMEGTSLISHALAIPISAEQRIQMFYQGVQMRRISIILINNK